MKSWGVRLVEGLKNWRTRNSDATPGQTLDAGRGEHPDQEPIEKTSIKATPTDIDEKASWASQQVVPANALADAQKVDDDREPRTLETASGQLEQTGREANKPSSSTSSLKRSPKQPRARTVEAGGQLTPSKELNAQEGRSSVDQTAGRHGPNNNRNKAPEQEPKKQVTGKALTKRSGRSGDKATVRTGPRNPSEEAVAVSEAQMLQAPFTGHLSEAKEATQKNTATPVVPAPPQKRSRLRKPETADEQVTDQDLAELEAENVRLKLLLRES